MKRALYLILGIAIAAGAVAWWRHCTAAPKEEGVASLKAVRLEPFSELTANISSHAFYLRNRKPAELLDLPPDISETSPGTRFYHLPVGRHKAFVLVQTLSGNRARVWIDANLNDRLSDEKPLSGSPKKYSFSKSDSINYFDFGTVSLAGEHFTSSHFCMAEYDKRYVVAFPETYNRGTIRLGKTFYRVAVIDGDYDGSFHTPFSPSENQRYWACDAFILDNSTRAILTRNRLDYGKMVPLGRYFKYDQHRYNPVVPEDTKGRYYTVSISPDGKTVQMTPAEPAMGTLQIGENKRISVRLLSDTATQPVNFRDEIALPAGRYQMQWGTLTFTDSDGGELELSADFQNDIRRGIFEIIEGQTTTLNPGPPFTVKTDVVKRGDEQLSINAGLVGNEGEEYGLRIVRSAARPELKILAENGDALHTGSMEYG